MKRIFVFLLFSFSLFSEEDDFFYDDECVSLFRDLAIVEKIDKKIQDELPFIFNFNMEGGYFNMPSARIPKAGNIGFSASSVPPYQLYALGFAFFDRLEFSGNYWVFCDIIENNFGHLGFGDDADRTANVKFSLLRKQDGLPELPEFAVGWNDFLGSQRFRAFYIAATKEFLDYNLELTLGWGKGRIHGFFAAGAWTPFRLSSIPLIKGITLAAEYDANNYKGHVHEHPKGKSVKSKLNGGLYWTILDYLHLSLTSIRGEKLGGAAQIDYNLGDTNGLFPKVFDPKLYKAPLDTEPIGLLRTREEFSQELAYAFKEQGFDLYDAFLLCDRSEKQKLWLKVINVRYPQEEIVRERILSIFSSLMPENIEEVLAVIEADGIPVQEYRFTNRELEKFRKGKIGEFELYTISPMFEASNKPSPYDSSLLYQRKKPIWMFTFRPQFRSYFGSTSGKFKFDVGFIAGPDGYLFDQIFYSLRGSYTAIANSKGLGSVDRLNPSQIINVRSDTTLYYQSSSVHMDWAYLQKSWNLQKGWFTRLALGYFEIAYAGAAWEALYYPVRSNWAIGFEAAALLKRSYHGIGFQRNIRKLDVYTPKYVSYYGLQYFLDFYYQLRPLQLDFKFTLGQFLAWDKGLRIEMGRTYPSGLRISFWYSFTNGNDKVGGSRYFDKGAAITFPLDIFMNKSSRTRIGYGMAAWLRDVGARARTGKELYDTLFYERYNYAPTFY